MGCDRRSQSRYLPAFPVSIHAPTWGATNDVARFDADFLVSIHAPTWGATSACLLVLIDLFQFQSTHPHGVRLLKTDASDFPIPVSIHAPTWGATQNVPTKLSADGQFQSTHPHGVRPLVVLNRVKRVCFNPRTHMGCDYLWYVGSTFRQ